MSASRTWVSDAQAPPPAAAAAAAASNNLGAAAAERVLADTVSHGHVLATPFGRRPLFYADATATGPALHSVEVREG